MNAPDRPIQVGLSSFAWRWSTSADYLHTRSAVGVHDLLQKSARLGAKVVQLCENVPLVKMADEELDQVRATAEALDVQLEVGVRGIDSSALSRSLHVCDRLQAGLLRMVLGDLLSEKELIALLKRYAAEFADHGVTMAIENHFRFGPATIRRIVDQIGASNVGVCLDPINSIAKLASPMEAIGLLAPVAMSVHVKDASIRRLNTGFYICGTEVGEGDIDIDYLINSVRRNGMKPNLLVECWMDKEESVELTLSMEERLIQRGLDYLWRKV